MTINKIKKQNTKWLNKIVFCTCNVITILNINFRAGNKGYAYTLVSPDQEKFAGDLIRALEASNVPVPESLRTIWLRYQAKQAAVSSIKLYLENINVMLSFLILLSTVKMLYKVFVYLKQM